MPMDRKRYPENWDEIAFEVKEAAGWKCRICKVQCYRPGEKVYDFSRVAATAHLDHNSADCGSDNLICLCSSCHLKYDRKQHAKSAAKKRLKKWWKDQMPLFPPPFGLPAELMEE